MSERRKRSWFVVGAALALAACGSSGGPAGGKDSAEFTDGGAARDGAIAVADLAAVEDLASAPVDSASAPVDLAGLAAPDGGVLYGQVALLEDAPGTTGGLLAGGYSASGIFYATSVDPYTCIAPIIGKCAVSTCMGGTNLGGPYSAGSVTISGGTATVTMSPGAGMVYGAKGTPTIFSGGETLTFAATGATAPAFSRTLTAPTPPHVTAPPQANGAITIDSTKDLPVTWTGGGAGYFFFALLPSGRSPLVCVLPATDGQLTVSQALLAQLGAGSYTYEAATLAIGHGSVGSWAILLEALALGAGADAKEFTGTATVQ